MPLSVPFYDVRLVVIIVSTIIINVLARKKRIFQSRYILRI